MPLGKNIRKLRAIQGLTQKDLADELGLTRGKIDTYERGVAAPPYHVILKIATHFGVTADQLLTASDEEIERHYLVKGNSGGTASNNEANNKLIAHLEETLRDYKKMLAEKDEIIKSLTSKR